MKNKKSMIAFLVAVLVPVYLEVMIHLLVNGSIGLRIFYPILFGLVWGLGIYIICSLVPKKAKKWVLWFLVTLMTVYFEIHLVCNCIFGEFMSLMQMFNGTDAVTNFAKQTLYGILRSWYKILLIAVPPFVTAWLCLKKKLEFPGWNWRRPVAALLAGVSIHFATVGVMATAGVGAYSVFDLYTDGNTTTEISVNNIGLLSTSRLEFGSMLFPGEEKSEFNSISGVFKLDPKKSYNMLDLDLEALADSRVDEDLARLDRYFVGVMPTEQHEYTGLLKDYNLITICAESFSPLLIDPVRTPALYKLANNGFVFKNYFGSFGSNTTNGEYTFCMGNYPDMSRSKSAASFYASQFNFLPFCLGNAFRSQGYQTMAYHNYSGEYYSRQDTHPNMGYEQFKAAGSGLDIEINWPSSDLEMIEASVGDYLNTGKPFHTYYMTFSGHYQYDWENPMSVKHKGITDGLPYNDTVKAYIACNHELELALQKLMEELEKAGVADKTVIVLTNDHYPYGLLEEDYNDFAGREVDTLFEKFRNSFICYVPNMEPVTVDTYCSSADILPTLLNLFGLPYDSRLLSGRDILSEGAHNMAILSDESFVTENYGFDTATGEVVVFTEGYEVDEEELVRRQNLIQNLFQVSLDVLNHDYYEYTIPKDQTQLAVEKEKNKHHKLPFTDIPEGKDTDCLEFLWGNGHIEAASATKFGYDATAAYAEFLDVLYRLHGKPNLGNTWVYLGSERKMTGKYLPAVKWAAHNKLLNVYPENMDSYRSLYRTHAAVTMMEYAAMMGLSTEVDDPELLDQMIAEHPERTAQECHALYWCYCRLIMQGSGGKLPSLMDSDPTLTRYDMARVLYRFWQYVLQESE